MNIICILYIHFCLGLGLFTYGAEYADDYSDKIVALIMALAVIFCPPIFIATIITTEKFKNGFSYSTEEHKNRNY